MTDDRLLEDPSNKDAPPTETNGPSRQGPRDAKGWDGKLRVDRKATTTDKDAASDSGHSEDDTGPVESIEADEGQLASHSSICCEGPGLTET